MGNTSLDGLTWPDGGICIRHAGRAFTRVLFHGGQQTLKPRGRYSAGRGSLTVHTAGVKYFQHSLKKTRGVRPVMSLMLALKRSAPVGDKDL